MRSAQHRRRSWTAPAACLLSGLLLALGLSACKRNDPPSAQAAQAKPPPPTVTVAPARAARVPVTVELPGRVNPLRVAQVRARVDGIVLKREFREGADVREGQRLFKIDPAPYQASLASAQAALLRAQANVRAQALQAARFQKLVASNAALASRDRPAPTSPPATLRCARPASTSATPT
jgi:membrane fusion protein (multidrug efflux system)